MSRLIWRDGRFRWGFIGLAVLSTLCWLAIDLLWRVIKLPFSDFILTVVLPSGLLLAAYLALWVWLDRRRGG